MANKKGIDKFKFIYFFKLKNDFPKISLNYNILFPHLKIYALLFNKMGATIEAEHTRKKNKNPV